MGRGEKLGKFFSLLVARNILDVRAFVILSLFPLCVSPPSYAALSFSLFACSLPSVYWPILDLDSLLISELMRV